MDMPEKIWAGAVDGKSFGDWDVEREFVGDQLYIHIDVVHRLVKRALEDAAHEADAKAEGSIAAKRIAAAIRALSPEEIMKKEGL